MSIKDHIEQLNFLKSALKKWEGFKSATPEMTLAVENACVAIKNHIEYEEKFIHARHRINFGLHSKRKECVDKARRGTRTLFKKLAGSKQEAVGVAQRQADVDSRKDEPGEKRVQFTGWVGSGKARQEGCVSKP